jgi:hypothetical protein
MALYLPLVIFFPCYNSCVFMLQICGVTIYHSCIRAYHLLVFLCFYVSTVRLYTNFIYKNIFSPRAYSNKGMYEITLWQIFVIWILFMVLLRSVNELAVNDTAHVRVIWNVFKRDYLGEQDMDGTVGLKGLWGLRCQLFKLGIMYSYGL